MAQFISLPAIAAMALAGAASGLYLGNSAIDEIDPTYMFADEGESRFYADLVPAASRVDDPPRPLHDALLDQGLGSGCVGCITYPEEYAPDHESRIDAYIGAYAAYSPPPTAEEIVTEVDAVLAEAARTRFEEVERYAYYPVRPDAKVGEPAQAVAVREVAIKHAAEVDCLVKTQCAGQPTPGI